MTADPDILAVVDNDVDAARRFGGVARLYGAAALMRFQRAHVCVVGVGGVGSWTAEALARSAIGHITLIDLDHVSESNINRQIHALDETRGQAKVLALANRIAQINPHCRVTPIEEFVTAENVDALVGGKGFDWVIDAIDNVAAKVALIAYCCAHSISIVTVGSAGGQRDATRVRVRDLAHTEHEPLLAKVRKRLRVQHGFTRNLKMQFGVSAVVSEEPIVYPDEVDACGPGAISPTAGATGLNCAGLGSSVAVTAVFGMVAAGYTLQQLAQHPEP